MDIYHAMKMLDNAQLGHEAAIKWVQENTPTIARALQYAITLGEEADEARWDAETRADELQAEVDELESTLYDAREAAHDFERDVADLERAMITLEEELAEARNALDEALNYEEA